MGGEEVNPVGLVDERAGPVDQPRDDLSEGQRHGGAGARSDRPAAECRPNRSARDEEQPGDEREEQELGRAFVPNERVLEGVTRGEEVVEGVQERSVHGLRG